MRRSLLKRKTPLLAKRPTPRRSVKRSKPGKSADERRHHDRIAAMPCAACGRWPVHVHHVISDGFKRITRCHRLVIPLCPGCHQDGPQAVHRIGTPAFEALHGFSQIALAAALWEASSG